jgi:hypothetical protein
MDERARKRKLDEADENAESDIEGVEKELPKQGLKTPAENKNKRQKTEPIISEILEKPSTLDANVQGEDDVTTQRAEQKRLKIQRKMEKSAAKAEKLKKKKEKIVENKVDLNEDSLEQPAVRDAQDEPIIHEDEVQTDDEIAKIDVDGLEGEKSMDRSSASPSPNPASPTFDAATNNPSTSTSTSSTIPPATAPKHIKLPTDPELLKSRLTARIEALRAARKADGPNGAPARNRQELMEARRKKEEQRRAHKKELRNRARAEEETQREAALASARDSPASSMMSPAIHTASENNFSFGRVAFADGTHTSEDLSTLLSAPKRKGPSDPATALQASEKKRLRIAGLDESKRADIEEKEVWLNAKKRAHGEKVRDDTSLLKKTLKRKEKAKKKSEKEWGERKEGVKKGIAMKQKKREENLKKRRDGSKKGQDRIKSAGSKGKKSKPKSRPGFEGSFSSGGKGKGK